jgi:translation initiation factor 3 subunit E
MLHISRPHTTPTATLIETTRGLAFRSQAIQYQIQSMSEQRTGGGERGERGEKGGRGTGRTRGGGRTGGNQQRPAQSAGGAAAPAAAPAAAKEGEVEA